MPKKVSRSKKKSPVRRKAHVKRKTPVQRKTSKAKPKTTNVRRKVTKTVRRETTVRKKPAKSTSTPTADERRKLYLLMTVQNPPFDEPTRAKLLKSRDYYIRRLAGIIHRDDIMKELNIKASIPKITETIKHSLMYNPGPHEFTARVASRDYLGVEAIPVVLFQYGYSGYMNTKNYFTSADPENTALKKDGLMLVTTVLIALSNPNAKELFRASDLPKPMTPMENARIDAEIKRRRRLFNRGRTVSFSDAPPRVYMN